MENKITLEQLTAFIKTKTDLTIENFCYNIRSIDLSQILILSAKYDCKSFNAICYKNAESLLKLLATIILGDKNNPLRSYLFGEDSETYNSLFELAENLSVGDFTDEELKKKIVEAILEDLNI